MVSNPQIWQSIAEYELDATGAEFQFSARLARDNGWTKAKACKAVEEYKRFIYLCAISTRELTPSDEVDQVWHMHLLYTRDYWGPFSKAVGKTIHHGPTAGGQGERQRYALNYEATLEFYEQEFMASPPVDIWPAAAVRFGVNYRRINVTSHIILPKPSAMVGTVAAGFLLALVMFGSTVFDQVGIGAAMAADELEKVPSTGASIWRFIYDNYIGILIMGTIFGRLIYVFILPETVKESIRQYYKSTRNNGCAGGGCGGGCGGE